MTRIPDEPRPPEPSGPAGDAHQPPAPPDLPEQPTASYLHSGSIWRGAAPRRPPRSSESTVGAGPLAGWRVTPLPPPADATSRESGAPPDDPSVIQSASAPWLSMAPTDGASTVDRAPDGEPTVAAALPRLEGVFSLEPTTHDELPAIGDDADDAPRAPAGPTYELARPIARGGMGEVWEAHQLALGRRIAVKRIRQDVLDRHLTQESRADIEWDFRQEAVATARLEHPNIVPIYDLGRGPDGSPLLAMKLVRGEPWETHLRHDREALDPVDFYARHIPILLDVAQAIAFAHASGIVHRDIKPGQVMIGPFGETLLMDWGLAIAIGGGGGGGGDTEPAAERRAADSLPLLPTPATASNPAGTPAMMAPEQTESTAEQIGTWTDLYLLGGTLYYVLTGRYPHQASSSHAALQHARIGMVERPRTGRRGDELPAELVALAMKSLARDPADRPRDVAEFIRGLEAFLSGAGRRHEAEQIVRDVRDAVLQLGSLGATETSHPLGDSTGNLARYAPATYARLAELHSSLNRARALWPLHPGITPLNDLVLEHHARLALRYGDLRLARLQSEQIEAAAAQEKLLQRVGDAEQQAERTVRTQRRLRIATTLALAALATAGIIFSATIWRNNRLLEDQTNLAMSEWNRAERHRMEARVAQLEAEATAGYAAAKASDNANLILFMLEGIAEHLDPQAERDMALRDSLADEVMSYLAEDPAPTDHVERLIDHARWRMRFAARMRNLGRYADAEALAREADRLLADQPAAGEALRLDAADTLAGILIDQGRLEEALELLEPAFAAARRLEEEEQELVWRMRRNLAEAYVALERFDDADRLLQEGIAIEAGRGDADPTRLASFLNSRGFLMRTIGNREEAVRMFDGALRGHLRAGEPDLKDVAAVRSNLGLSLADLGRFDEAEEQQREALAAARQVYAPDHPQMGTILNNLALLLERTGRIEEALATYRQVLPVYRAALGERHAYVAVTLSNIGNALSSLGRSEEAVPVFREAIEIARVALGEENAHYGIYLNNLAMTLRELGRGAEALPLQEQAVLVLERAHGADHPWTLQLMANWGFSVADEGDAAAGVDIIRRARERMEEAGLDANDVWVKVLQQEAMVLARLERWEEALATAVRADEAALALFAPDHPGLNATRQLRGVLCWRAGRDGEARDLLAPCFAEGGPPLDERLAADVRAAWEALGEPAAAP